jgi:3-hydroxybutyrate dehydrogenase
VSLDLTNRKALVTGAASGIGAACARRLAEAGALVTVLDVAEDKAKEVASEIGGEPLAVDMSDPAAVAELEVDVDILVNNAGMQYVSAVQDFPPEKWQQIINIMLTGPFLLCRAALPKMYERGYGRIVHISSVHGLRASAYKSAYVSAKHGLEGLSKTLAREGGPYGVTSNTICPAYVRTPLVENQIADQARIHGISEQDVIEKIMLTEPAIQRLLEPAEVAEAMAYLCTGEASFINGSSQVMDGGWTAR